MGLLTNPFPRTQAATGDIDPSFSASIRPDQSVWAVAVQSDQKLLIAGDFTSLGTVEGRRVARLNSDGTPDAGFTPAGMPNSSILVVVPRPDGRILAGGGFNQIGAQPRPHLVQFNADGSLDTTFTPPADLNGAVHCLLLLPDGDLLVGGQFSLAGGAARGTLIRLKPDGSVDTGFAPGVNALVRTIARDDSGRILIGGDFTQVGGRIRNRVARLQPGGTLDETFDPGAGPNSSVHALVPQADGTVVIGGSFGIVHGANRAYLCRLNATGLPVPGASATFNNAVYSLSAQPDGRLVAAGAFTAVSGQPRSGVARLRPDTTLDTGLDPGTGANGPVLSAAVQADGRIVLGGAFTVFRGTDRVRLVRLEGLSGSVGGEIEFATPAFSVSEGQPSVTIEVRRTGTTAQAVSVEYVTQNGTATGGDYIGQSDVLTFAPGETLKSFSIPIRSDSTVEDDETVNLVLMNPTGGAVLGDLAAAVLTIVNDDGATTAGSVDPGLANGVGGSVHSLALQPDGRIVVAGEFSELQDGVRTRIARLNRDGSLDGTFLPSAWVNSTVFDTAVQGDGRIVIAGQFTEVNGIARRYLARFRSNGSLDPIFDPGTGPNSSVYTVLVLPGGDLLIGGAFTQIGPDPQPYLARIYPDGTRNPEFILAVNGAVRDLVPTPDGRVIAVGDFTQVGGRALNRVARFSPEGELDEAFDPGSGPNSSVYAAVVQPDGRILLGGAFSAVNGTPRSHLCRLEPDGMPDIGFRGMANAPVETLALQADGRLLVGGHFTQSGSTPAGRLMRLLGDGTLDPTFDIGAGANGIVRTLAIELDGKVLAGGDFTQFRGLNRTRIVRLLGSTESAGGEIEFSTSRLEVSEGQPTVTVTVLRHGPTPAGATVDYGTVNGTAGAGDYTPQSGRLTFGAGETSRTFSVPVRADALLEDDEDFEVVLSNPGGGAILGGRRTARVVILDDDPGLVVGGIDTGFRSAASGSVTATASLADGSTLVVGDFTELRDGARQRIARIRSDGTLDPGFSPGAWLDGRVEAVRVQPDGRILVGGHFTVASGLPRRFIARFHADGTPDTSFNPGVGPNSVVYTLELEPDGDILAGGAFSTYSGEPIAHLARLFSDGTPDTTFRPDINGAVRALARASDGALLIGGDFTSVGGRTRRRVARLLSEGTLDARFDPGEGPNSTVFQIGILPGGRVLIGGQFSDVAGVGLGYLCRLDSLGLPDTGYLARINSPVNALAVQPDGRVVIGGQFTQVNGSPATRISRLLADGSTDPGFDVGPGANGTVLSLEVLLDGSILAGGDFTELGGLARPRLVRLNGISAAAGGELEFSSTAYRVGESQSSVSIEVRRLGTATEVVSVDYATGNGTANAGDYTGQSGTLVFGVGELSKTFLIPILPDSGVEDDETILLTLSNPGGGAVLGGQRSAVVLITDDDNSTRPGGIDTTFAGGSSGQVLTTAIQPDGRVLVGGSFSVLGGLPRQRIGRLMPDGSVDGSFLPSAWLDGAVHAIALQPDGRILVGGAFSTANGVPRTRVARFRGDGTLDPSFDPGPGPNSTVYTLLALPGGEILIGGAFSTVSSQPRAYLARLYSDGNLDPGFDAGMNNVVWALAPDTEGGLYAGGDFTRAGGLDRNRVARLLASGAAAPGFDPQGGPNSTVRALQVQPDGRVILGGHFSQVDGANRPHLARLLPGGGRDVTYEPAINSVVHAMVLRADNRLYVAGDFTQIGSQPAQRVARVLPDGSPDATFLTAAGANGTVSTLSLQSDGHLIVGGAFTRFADLARPGLVRLLADDSGPETPFEFTGVIPEGGQLRLQGLATPGRRYILQYSRDLSVWFAIATNTASDTIVEWIDPNATDPHRVYRAVGE